MRMSGKVWKVLGVAGVAGVAATGVVIARDQRRRSELSPDQVRKQLRTRLADLDRDAGPDDVRREGSATEPSPATLHVPVKRRRRR